MAFARSMAMGNSVTMMARITEEERAAPSPCTKRAPMSIPWELDAPHTADDSVNRVTPAMNTRLRPTRSPSRPANSSVPPKVIR